MPTAGSRPHRSDDAGLQTADDAATRPAVVAVPSRAGTADLDGTHLPEPEPRRSRVARSEPALRGDEARCVCERVGRASSADVEGNGGRGAHISLDVNAV